MEGGQGSLSTLLDNERIGVRWEEPVGKVHWDGSLAGRGGKLHFTSVLHLFFHRKRVDTGAGGQPTVLRQGVVEELLRRCTHLPDSLPAPLAVEAVWRIWRYWCQYHHPRTGRPGDRQCDGEGWYWRRQTVAGVVLEAIRGWGCRRRACFLAERLPPDE